jgi:small conductance mechanosensitive channel
MANWSNSYQDLFWASLIPFVSTLVSALGLWIAGSFVIKGLRRLARVALARREVDPVLARYMESVLDLSLKLLLLLLIFSVFGVETSSFAAVLVAASLALGAALSGLLSDLAAGIFLVTIRPFKVGDRLILSDVVGTVEQLGLFMTTIHTDSEARVFIGNRRLFAENLQNRVRGTLVRVDLKIVLPHGADPHEAIRRLDERVRAIPGVSKEGAPQIGVLELGRAGRVLAIRPFCDSSRYVSVYYETNAVIWETFDELGYPPPETYHAVRGDGLVELEGVLPVS